MDNWNKLLEFVRNEEEKYYSLSFEEMKKQNMNGYFESLGQAVAFQKVRYFIEELDEQEAGE